MAARLEAIQGDIAATAADAIVNAANDHLWMGAGVAGALKRAGGEQIEIEAMSKGPIPVGGAVATGAGRLPARWVIHAAAMGQDLRTDADQIRRATASALRVADEIGARSVALSALGTGVGGFSVEECAGSWSTQHVIISRADPRSNASRSSCAVMTRSALSAPASRPDPAAARARSAVACR